MIEVFASLRCPRRRFLCTIDYSRWAAIKREKSRLVRQCTSAQELNWLSNIVPSKYIYSPWRGSSEWRNNLTKPDQQKFHWKYVLRIKLRTKVDAIDFDAIFLIFYIIIEKSCYLYTNTFLFLYFYCKKKLISINIMVI